MDPNQLLSAESVGNLFTHHPIFSISIGVSALIATILYLASFSGVLHKEMKRRGMKRKIDSLKDHYILAGFGRVGRQVAQELAQEGESFVILERDESKMDEAKKHDWPYIVGDVAVDETLFEKAGVEKAKAVIISVGTDADAIFMAISVRAIKPDVFIVARASSREAADKLTKVGVNRVAMPYQIGGYHMATMAIRPSVVDFLDTLVDPEQQELEMEEFVITDKSPYVGQALEESPFHQEGIAVLVIRHEDGRATINPVMTTKFRTSDRLVVMGSEAKLQDLTKEVAKKQAKLVDAQDVASDIRPSPFQKEEA